MEQPKQEICQIRVMFPAESDEQAISCKKKIKEVLADVPDVNIHFSLMAAPPPPK